MNDGTLFVASTGSVLAFVPNSGARKWQYSLHSYQFSSLSVGAETVTVVDEPDLRKRVLITLDRNGRKRWRFDGWTVTGPTVHDGRVFAGGKRIGGFDAKTGEQKWATDSSGYLYQAPVVKTLLVAGGNASEHMQWMTGLNSGDLTQTLNPYSLKPSEAGRCTSIRLFQMRRANGISTVLTSTMERNRGTSRPRPNNLTSPSDDKVRISLTKPIPCMPSPERRHYR